jgi:hypothetical protein
MGKAKPKRTKVMTLFIKVIKAVKSQGCAVELSHGTKLLGIVGEGVCACIIGVKPKSPTRTINIKMDSVIFFIDFDFVIKDSSLHLHL